MKIIFEGTIEQILKDMRAYVGACDTYFEQQEEFRKRDEANAEAIRKAEFAKDLSAQEPVPGVKTVYTVPQHVGEVIEVPSGSQIVFYGRE